MSSLPSRCTSGEMMEKIVKSEDEWRDLLTPQQFHVLRERGTERAFTGVHHDAHESGLYRCAGCGLLLFDASTQFDSGTGWPSFFRPVDPEHVEERVDRLESGAKRATRDHAHWMLRTELLCARCGGHLGHVFDDGPRPTGQRYCINSASLRFEGDSSAAERVGGDD